jgi:hypothetical protein
VQDLFFLFEKSKEEGGVKKRSESGLANLELIFFLFRMSDKQAVLQREREQKIFEIERFIDEQLKVDLKRVLDQRDSIYEEIAK